MRNKNLLVIIIAIVAIAVVAALALLLPKDTPAPPPAETELTAAGYVYITAGTEGRWFELPKEDSGLTLRRTLDDGTVKENHIMLTPEGAYMASSSCDNQDCVEQGLVSLSNKGERILQNLVLCLPNEVSIELFSREEMQQMMDAAE